MDAQSEVLRHRVRYRRARKIENVARNYEAAIFVVLSELLYNSRGLSLFVFTISDASCRNASKSGHLCRLHSQWHHLRPCLRRAAHPTDISLLYVMYKKIAWRISWTPRQVLRHASASYMNDSRYPRDQDSHVVAHPNFRLSDHREEGKISPEEIEALRMECSTWALLQAVMPSVQFLSLENIELTFFPLSYCAFKTEPPPQPSTPAVLTADPYTPTSALTPATLAASRTLSALVMVRQWLHDTTTPSPTRTRRPAIGASKSTA